MRLDWANCLHLHAHVQSMHIIHIIPMFVTRTLFGILQHEWDLWTKDRLDCLLTNLRWNRVALQIYLDGLKSNRTLYVSAVVDKVVACRSQGPLWRHVMQESEIIINNKRVIYSNSAELRKGKERSPAITRLLEQFIKSVLSVHF